MTGERRNHLRVKTKGLKARVRKIRHRLDDEVAVEGEILDISYSGIRIKLKAPIDNPDNGKVKITMNLPESGEPFTIHGTLKHQPGTHEYGVHCHDHSHESIDDLLFECVRLNDETLLIKTA